MSHALVGPSLLSTFESNGDEENVLLSDYECNISLFDNEDLIPTTSHTTSYQAFTPDTSSPKENIKARHTSGGQPEQAEANHQKPAAKLERKRRKSWGEELPIPTTNLPPRKRAKTAEEKEQRRIERVLRNRAAAQSSRERKRKEVERLAEERATLSESNTALRDRLLAMEEENKALRRELDHMQQTIKRYEEYMRVAASDIAANAPLISASSYGAPEPTVAEGENLFFFLDNPDPPPVATINPSMLYRLGGPGLAEDVMSAGSWS
ncbi:hypothetical protein HOY82DRAFT_647039 [Tuber indicum]|nr:hypothetical protein HOY82DRAFT_647039 [Tuber indicum]